MEFIIVAALAAFTNPYLFGPAVLIGLFSRSIVWLLGLSTLLIVGFLQLYFTRWPGILLFVTTCIAVLTWSLIIFHVRREFFDTEAT